jgi:rhodanese-related sulfurtransferase
MERTIKPENLNPDETLVIDVRREADYAASNETIPGAFWKNPEKIDAWITALPKTQDVVIYCVRGGAVSNRVVDRLHAEGIKARFIEGGIEGYKTAGGKVASK